MPDRSRKQARAMRSRAGRSTWAGASSRARKARSCELTTAEFNLLAVLLERPGRVLSRDELMDLLKGHDWTPLDRSIDGLVARLRKKIERGE